MGFFGTKTNKNQLLRIKLLPKIIFDHESSRGQKNLYCRNVGAKLHLYNFIMFVYIQKRFGNYILIIMTYYHNIKHVHTCNF